MTRAEANFLAEHLSDLRERQAVSETKMDNMAARLDAHEKETARKLDLILENQAQGKAEQAELSIAIKKMIPDWRSVQSVKQGWKFIIWISGIAGAIGATVAYSKSWILMNVQWFMGK